ncbi:MAG: hypothetical protein IJI46_09515 [Erysipelotrichaceae bacterium]|nr:hypothetical protein [Erysipelotrichaceae bacterium]
MFDCIIIYNAFPHFFDPQGLITNLVNSLNKGGSLTIAHGMSRERLNMHHDNVQHVSKLLPDLNEMRKLFEGHLEVTKTISDEKMYLITGVKR